MFFLEFAGRILRVSYKHIPKCFCQLAQIGASLKNIFGWDELFNLLKNTFSWACLFKSELNDVFHLKAHSDIFCRSLPSLFTELLLSGTVTELLLSGTAENSDVSCAKIFTANYYITHCFLRCVWSHVHTCM